MRATVLTISTSRASGDPSPDESGPLLAAMARDLGAELVESEIVADDREAIEARLRRADADGVDLVLTTGGTGFAPSDVTPEATRAVIGREAPGIAEAMRLASREHTEHWMLSRAVAGIAGRSLIVNFPGSPRAVAQVIPAVAPALPHALALLGGRTRHV